ncbi:MAG: hypothetical protein KA214_08830 [Neisseriaceae bacterium]|nr:hypothetical protein [Neisseriaceae bacterium]
MTLVTSTRLALLLALIPLAQAQIIAPKTLLLNGQTYELVYSEDGQPMHVYEYTPQDQETDDWDQMITLHYTPMWYVKGTTTANLLQAQKQELAQERPKPSYSVRPLSNGFMLHVLYPPLNPNSPLKQERAYESSVQRNFSVPTCEGIVSLHFATRLVPEPDASPAAIQAQLKQLTQQGQEQVLQQDWQPQCH